MASATYSQAAVTAIDTDIRETGSSVSACSGYSYADFFRLDLLDGSSSFMKTVSMAGHKLINTMQHDDPIDLLLCQAFAVSEPLTDSQLIPVLESSDLESELSQWQDVVHSLTYDAPSLPMANLQERILQRINNKYVNNQAVDNQCGEIEAINSEAIEAEAIEADEIKINAIDKNHQNPAHPLSQTISTWQKQAATATWSPYANGVTISRLDLDLVSRQIYCFVRVEPGAKFPRHRHTASEEILMLEGDLIIEDQTYYPGDYIYSLPGTIHQPRSSNGCLVIVRASIDDQILDDEILV